MKTQSIIHTLVLIAGIVLSPLSIAEPVWVDVRSFIENKIDNIDGDIRISYSSIVEEMSKIHPDKTTDIRLYCRSGARAQSALSLLNQAGYSNVKNVGSINDARRIRALSQ